VLSLDVLRALGSDARVFQVLKAEVGRILTGLRYNRLVATASLVHSALDSAASWWISTKDRDLAALEAGARGFAMTLGRSMELALLIRHAQWSIDTEGSERSVIAAKRFGNAGIDSVAAGDIGDARILFGEK
jgi:hypothetical protein